MKKDQETPKPRNPLKYRRLLAELSQREVARYLNMSQSGYGKIERGESDPHVSLMVKLSTLYRCSIDDLI